MVLSRRPRQPARALCLREQAGVSPVLFGDSGVFVCSDYFVDGLFLQ